MCARYESLESVECLQGECGECAGSLRRVLGVCRGSLDSVECFQENCEVLREC